MAGRPLNFRLSVVNVFCTIEEESVDFDSASDVLALRPLNFLPKVANFIVSSDEASSFCWRFFEGILKLGNPRYCQVVINVYFLPGQFKK